MYTDSRGLSHARFSYPCNHDDSTGAPTHRHEKLGVEKPSTNTDTAEGRIVLGDDHLDLMQITLDCEVVIHQSNKRPTDSCHGVWWGDQRLEVMPSSCIK